MIGNLIGRTTTRYLLGTVFALGSLGLCAEKYLIDDFTQKFFEGTVALGYSSKDKIQVWRDGELTVIQDFVEVPSGKRYKTFRGPVGEVRYNPIAGSFLLKAVHESINGAEPGYFILSEDGVFSLVVKEHLPIKISTGPRASQELINDQRRAMPVLYDFRKEKPIRYIRGMMWASNGKDIVVFGTHDIVLLSMDGTPSRQTSLKATIGKSKFYYTMASDFGSHAFVYTKKRLYELGWDGSLELLFETRHRGGWPVGPEARSLDNPYKLSVHCDGDFFIERWDCRNRSGDVIFTEKVFSINDQSRKAIAFDKKDQKVRLYDLDKGIVELEAPVEGVFTSILISDDSQYIAGEYRSQNKKETVCLWIFEIEGQEIKTLHRVGKGPGKWPKVCSFTEAGVFYLNQGLFNQKKPGIYCTNVAGQTCRPESLGGGSVLLLQKGNRLILSKMEEWEYEAPRWNSGISIQR